MESYLGKLVQFTYNGRVRLVRVEKVNTQRDGRTLLVGKDFSYAVPPYRSFYKDKIAGGGVKVY